jgi:hypothetical protein
MLHGRYEGEEAFMGIFRWDDAQIGNWEEFVQNKKQRVEVLGGWSLLMFGVVGIASFGGNLDAKAGFVGASLAMMLILSMETLKLVVETAERLLSERERQRTTAAS